MSKKTKKEKSALVISVNVVAKEIAKRRSIKPIAWFFRKYEYGGRRQLSGNIVDYVKYCKRTHHAICVDEI